MHAIFTVQHFNNGGLVNQKIVIQSIRDYNPYKEIFSKEKNQFPMFGPTFWEITINQLPVTEKHCLEVYSSLCSDISQPTLRNACYPPCIMYGPGFLAFDEKAKRLYVTSYSEAIGNAAGQLFSFIADLSHREIKFFKIIDYTMEGALSPNGKYLALFGRKHATLYNTYNGNTKKLFSKRESNIKTVEWLNSDKLQIEYSAPQPNNAKHFTTHREIFETKI